MEEDRDRGPCGQKRSEGQAAASRFPQDQHSEGCDGRSCRSQHERLQRRERPQPAQEKAVQTCQAHVAEAQVVRFDEVQDGEEQIAPRSDCGSDSESSKVAAALRQPCEGAQ